MKAEFKAGDTVHFHNYTDRKPITARVKKVTFDRFMGRHRRLEYHLSGISAPLVSITGPRSILESRFYSPVDVCDAFKD